MFQAARGMLYLCFCLALMYIHVHTMYIHILYVHVCYRLIMSGLGVG